MKLKEYLLECKQCKRKINVKVLGEIIDAGLCHFCGNPMKVIAERFEPKERKNGKKEETGLV